MCCTTVSRFLRIYIYKYKIYLFVLESVLLYLPNPRILIFRYYDFPQPRRIPSALWTDNSNACVQDASLKISSGPQISTQFSIKILTNIYLIYICTLNYIISRRLTRVLLFTLVLLRKISTILYMFLKNLHFQYSYLKLSPVKT